MAGRPAALWLLLGLAVLIGATTPVSAADGASSDIALHDVTVSLLEASGSASSTHKVAGTGAGLKLVLDHTRTLKVGRQHFPPPPQCHCLAAVQYCSTAACGRPCGAPGWLLSLKRWLPNCVCLCAAAVPRCPSVPSWGRVMRTSGRSRRLCG